MTGAAFMISDTGWACSNEVILDFFKESVRGENGKIKAIKQTQTLSVQGIFGELKQDEKVDVVLKPDTGDQLFGFTGNVRSIKDKHVVLNILTKTDRIKEILSNITFKKVEKQWQ